MTARATTSTSGPATTTRRPRASTPTSACSPATSRSAPTWPTCSTSSPATRGRAATARCWWRPTSCATRMIAEIERTVAAHEEGKPARIAMKLNSLVDRRCIRALYRASQAGVPVDLNIRGICCLVPGVPGVSENISVNSVVGRYLEHSRIFAFERDGETKVYIGSADLMPRNLDTRVELVTPVDDPSLRDDLLDTLERSLADDTNSWDLGADGIWRRRTQQGHEPRSVQRELMLGHQARAAEGTTAARRRTLSASSRPRLRCSRHVRSLGLRSRRHPRGAGRGRGLRRRRRDVAWKGTAALRPGRGRADALRHAREPLGPPAAAARRRRARARSQRPRAVGRGRVLRRLQRRHRAARLRHGDVRRRDARRRRRREGRHGPRRRRSR